MEEIVDDVEEEADEGGWCDLYERDVDLGGGDMLDTLGGTGE